MRIATISEAEGSLPVRDRREGEPGLCIVLPKTTIKHIVISGGGVSGFTAYGILRESHKAGLWDLKNIKSFQINYFIGIK